MGYSRVVWAMSGVLWLIITVLWCAWFGWPAIAVAAVCAILPDIALLGAFTAPGQLKPARVPLYNALHNALAAVIVLAAGLAIFLLTGAMDGGFWGVGLVGLVWFVHIAAERALGFGRRAADGSMIPVN